MILYRFRYELLYIKTLQCIAKKGMELENSVLENIRNQLWEMYLSTNLNQIKYCAECEMIFMWKKYTIYINVKNKYKCETALKTREMAAIWRWAQKLKFQS